MRRPLIAVVGASRPAPSSVRAAEALGRALVGAGYRIVCGGRDGVMAAVCKGARSSDAWSDGATIGLLPGNDATDANAWVDIAIPTGLGIARNAIVARAGDAVVAVGGSAGTLSELALAWQMGRPIAALHTDGFVKIIRGLPHGEILGAHIIGDQATELIAEMSLARRLEATSEDLIATVHAHPTMHEAVHEAALASEGRVIHA